MVKLNFTSALKEAKRQYFSSFSVYVVFNKLLGTGPALSHTVV